MAPQGSSPVAPRTAGARAGGALQKERRRSMPHGRCGCSLGGEPGNAEGTIRMMVGSATCSSRQRRRRENVERGRPPGGGRRRGGAGAVGACTAAAPRRRAGMMAAVVAQVIEKPRSSKGEPLPARDGPGTGQPGSSPSDQAATRMPTGAAKPGPGRGAWAAQTALPHQPSPAAQPPCSESRGVRTPTAAPGVRPHSSNLGRSDGAGVQPARWRRHRVSGQQQQQ